MNKKLREEVKAKYDGRCAFCGCDLGKGWHVWDIELIQTAINELGAFEKVNETLENLMPACKPCGSLRIKSSSKKMTIEEFRKDVLKSFHNLQQGGVTGNSYARAIRFGFIEETGKSLKFYFETVPLKPVLAKNSLAYEEWKAELIRITAEKTGRPEYEIKINDQGAREWYDAGIDPYFTFRETYENEG